MERSVQRIVAACGVVCSGTDARCWRRSSLELHARECPPHERPFLDGVRKLEYYSRVASDPAAAALERIAVALEAIDVRYQAEIQARDARIKTDSQREFVAIVTLAITALLAIASASSFAARFGPFAQQLKDYQPLVVVGLTVLIAVVYRAFQLRVIPLEMIVGIGFGLIVVAASTLAPSIHPSWISFVLFGAIGIAALYVFSKIKWDFGAEIAAVISIGVLLVILGVAGFITVKVGGSNWLQVGFLGQTLLLIDSAFPKLVVLDFVAVTTPIIVFSQLCFHWGAFRNLFFKSPQLDDATRVRIMSVSSAILVGGLMAVITNNPLDRFAHMPWPFVG